MNEPKSVGIGSKVSVVAKDKAIRSFEISSDGHAAPERGIISTSSPLGRALVGHRAGEAIRYLVHGREHEVQIITIE